MHTICLSWYYVHSVPRLWFHASLPPSLANAPNLRKIELAHNLLSGSIPSVFYQMQNLQELHIDSNNLGGTLSQADEPLYFGIREFAINNNTFEGRFPVEQFEKTEILSKALPASAVVSFTYIINSLHSSFTVYS